MALIEFKNHQKKLVPTPVALQIWRVIAGITTPDETQAKFCSNVNSVKLNWQEAPDEYIEHNLHDIIPFALHEWAVDPFGRPIRPTTRRSWEFAKRWGLWSQGKPSPLVARPKHQPRQMEILSGV